MRYYSTDSASEHANSLVRAWILARYRSSDPIYPEHRGANQHLLNCHNATVSCVDGGDGMWDCDTCDYVRLSAVVSCQHGEREEYRIGKFGEMIDFIEELEHLEH